MKLEEHAIVGDCLEAIGIPSKGVAVIDRDMKPAVFDVVWCSGCIGGELGGFLKQIIDTSSHPVVHTCYKDPAKNYAFYAKEIYGTVIKVMDADRNVVWERPEPAEKLPGHWVDVEWRSDWQVMEATCSQCYVRGEVRWDLDEHGEIVPNSPYCPACGAEMKEA